MSSQKSLYKWRPDKLEREPMNVWSPRYKSNHPYSSHYIPMYDHNSQGKVLLSSSLTCRRVLLSSSLTGRRALSCRVPYNFGILQIVQIGKNLAFSGSKTRDGFSLCRIVANHNFFQKLKRIFEDFVAMLKEKSGKMSRTLLHVTKKFCGLCRKSYAKKKFR